MWPLFDLEKQYAQNPSIKREEVQKLHQWLKAQPHLPELLEHEVLLFYHTCDHHMEYTKQVIDNYYTFRTHTEEFFGNLDMDSPQMRIGRQVMAGFPLDKLTDEGYCAIVAKIMDIEPSKYDFVAVLKILFSVQDMWLQGNDLIPGIVFIIDLEGLSFSQLARMSLPQIKKLMYFLQEAIPTRLISVHFVNPSSIMERLMSLINPFIKKELRNSFIVHTSLDSLHEYLPRHILPQELGGDDLPCKQLADHFYNKVYKHRLDIIEYNNSRRVNEKLRPDKAKNSPNDLGTQGNFRKLDID